MSATREELEQFKNTLREHAKVNNLEVILEGLKTFYEKFKHIVTEEDANEIKLIVEGMSILKEDLSPPTPYEYLLFLIVLVFVIAVFGEIPLVDFIC